MSRAVRWRCFHCNETFTQAQERQAHDHFGADEGKKPVCLLREPGEYHVLRALRDAQEELDSRRAEDTDLHRALHAMAADHQQALRREEEKGYARGVADNTGAGHADLVRRMLREIGEDGGLSEPTLLEARRVAGFGELPSLAVVAGKPVDALPVGMGRPPHGVYSIQHGKIGWRFVMHRVIGPSVVDRHGQPKTPQPRETSAFWTVTSQWAQQGMKATAAGVCLFDPAIPVREPESQEKRPNRP